MSRTRQFALAVFTVIGGAFLASTQAQPPAPGKAPLPPPGAPAPGAPPAPGAAPPAGEFKTVRGTVKEYTKAERGEMDGLILSDGTTIHWPPHLQEKFVAAARPGDRIRVSGFMETTPGNEKKLEVSTLTNLGTNKAVENPDRPAPAANQGKGDLEERIQALEEKIDRLNAEIDALKRRK